MGKQIGIDSLYTAKNIVSGHYSKTSLGSSTTCSGSRSFATLIASSLVIALTFWSVFTSRTSTVCIPLRLRSFEKLLLSLSKYVARSLTNTTSAILVSSLSERASQSTPCKTSGTLTLCQFITLSLVQQ